MGDRAAIILAAGKSTRMNSDLPKVLHDICGRSMLDHVISACRLAGVDRILVVVGHGKERVRQHFADSADSKNLVFIEQREQKGTGHAVLCCKRELEDFEGSVLVIAGDMPLVRRETLVSLMEEREQSGDALTLATTILDDPSGYGRILRSADGSIECIVEHRDCTDEQKAIREVNPSYYCFDSRFLWEALDKVQPMSAKGEYYITDTVGILKNAGKKASAYQCVPADDATGINSRLDLCKVARLMQDRIQSILMTDGVSIVDPDNTWIECEVAVGRDTTIFPFTYIAGGARIGEGCRIGPFAHIGPGEVVESGEAVTGVPVSAPASEAAR